MCSECKRDGASVSAGEGILRCTDVIRDGMTYDSALLQQQYSSCSSASTTMDVYQPNSRM